MALFEIYNGDCIEVMQTIPDGSVDMICTDLPYGTTANSWDTVIPFDKLWEQYNRITKETAAIVLTAQPPFDKVLGASNIKYLKYEWIWYKIRATGHLNATKQPLKNHENVLVFYRKQCKYNPQGLIKTVAQTIKLPKTHGGNYGMPSKEETVKEFENYPRSVLAMDSESNTVHPTQKPVGLMEYMIRTYTDEGETVLDCCMGSGTTGVAAVQCGRKFIGIERDPDYFKICQSRIEGASVAAAKSTNMMDFFE